METLNAMYLIRSVHSEWYTIQTLSANDAGEAGRMIRFAGSSQYSIQYRFRANTALFQSIKIVLLAVGFALQRVERFALQIDLAHETAEAIYVKDLVHRRTSSSFSLDLAAALRADAVYIAIFVIIFHPLNQEICEDVDLQVKVKSLNLRYVSLHRSTDDCYTVPLIRFNNINRTLFF